MEVVGFDEIPTDPLARIFPIVDLPDPDTPISTITITTLVQLKSSRHTRVPFLSTAHGVCLLLSIRRGRKRVTGDRDFVRDAVPVPASAVVAVAGVSVLAN